MNSLPMPVLGIDTCGPAGSVALAKVSAIGGSILGRLELEGKTYSATLVEAAKRLLNKGGLALSQLGCIVIVHGPGSFTGVRVGISAAKGLAVGAGMPVVAISRLAVLAAKSGVATAALDAHRHEIYLRLGSQELLAGSAELASLQPPASIAVCDPGAEAALAAAWPAAGLVRVAEPTAADAIGLASARIRAASFDDVAILDGHYLRRSDAEIFGEKGRPSSRRAEG